MAVFRPPRSVDSVETSCTEWVSTTNSLFSVRFLQLNIQQFVGIVHENLIGRQEWLTRSVFIEHCTFCERAPMMTFLGLEVVLALLIQSLPGGNWGRQKRLCRKLHLALDAFYSTLWRTLYAGNRSCSSLYFLQNRPGCHQRKRNLYLTWSNWKRKWSSSIWAQLLFAPSQTKG